MCKAVSDSKDWKNANTEVVTSQDGLSTVYLHGNKIAEVGDDFLTIFDGGYQSVTTKSRLNALINEFCNAVTDGVFQKNYQWFVSDNNITKEFTGEYTLLELFIAFTIQT